MDPIDRYFHEQSGVIARCQSVQELLDLMAEYRDGQRTATARGNTLALLRLSDLLELTERRVSRLKAQALCRRQPRRDLPRPSAHGQQETPRVSQTQPAGHESAVTAPRATRQSQPRGDEHLQRLHAQLAQERAARQRAQEDHQAAMQQAEIQRRAAEEQAEAQRQEALRTVRENREARERAEQKRQAAEELAELRQQEAEREAKQNRLAIERAEQARREAEQRAAAIEEERAELRRLRVELEEARAARERAEEERRAAEEREQRAEQDRLAAEDREQQAERERLAAEERANALERAELEREIDEQRRSLERQAAENAARRSLPPVSAAPSTPATQSATIEQPRLAAPTATPARPEPPSASTTPTTPQEPEASPALTLTGADLARFRAERALSQRAAARVLGVSASTVAKAERDPAKVLGPLLQVALHNALRRDAPCAP